MREGDEQRVAIHEAGHAVTYLVIGRPISRAIVARNEHQVDPVPGTYVAVEDEAVAMAAGWAAEERRLRLGGADDTEVQNVWMNGGHHDDRGMLARLAAQVDAVSVDEAEERADGLVEAHWALVVAVADALLAESVIGQSRLESLGAEHGVTFTPGSTAHPRTSIWSRSATPPVHGSSEFQAES